MKTCATCKFFGDHAPLDVPIDVEPWFKDTDHHRCVRIIHGNRGGAHVDHADGGVSAEPAVVTDGSGYAASLRVLPTFGCVLHEDR